MEENVKKNNLSYLLRCCSGQYRAPTSSPAGCLSPHRPPVSTSSHRTWRNSRDCSAIQEPSYHVFMSCLIHDLMTTSPQTVLRTIPVFLQHFIQHAVNILSLELFEHQQWEIASALKMDLVVTVWAACSEKQSFSRAKTLFYGGGITLTFSRNSTKLVNLRSQNVKMLISV